MIISINTQLSSFAIGYCPVLYLDAGILISLYSFLSGKQFSHIQYVCASPFLSDDFAVFRFGMKSHLHEVGLWRRSSSCIGR